MSIYINTNDMIRVPKTKLEMSHFIYGNHTIRLIIFLNPIFLMYNGKFRLGQVSFRANHFSINLFQW